MTSPLGDIVDSFTRVVNQPPTAEVLQPIIAAAAQRIANATGASVRVNIANGKVMTWFSGPSAAAATRLMRRQLELAMPNLRTAVAEAVLEEFA